MDKYEEMLREELKLLAKDIDGELPGMKRTILNGMVAGIEKALDIYLKVKPKAQPAAPQVKKKQD